MSRRRTWRLTARGEAVLTLTLCALVFILTLLFTTPVPAPWTT